MIAPALPEILVVPNVLADTDSETGSVPFQNLRPAGWFEVTVFVEDVVGGQKGFVEGAADLAFFEQHGAIEKRPAHLIRIRGSDANEKRGSGGELGCNFMQCQAASADEAVVHQKIARQVSHEREFRGDDQIRALLAGATGAAHDERGVAGDIAGRGVELEQGNAQWINPEDRGLVPRTQQYTQVYWVGHGSVKRVVR